MKGKSSLFSKRKFKCFLKLDLQFFASKNVSETGIAIQESLTNQKMKNLVGELYRQGALIGDGSAMAAASEQVRTGILVGGRDHITKIKERIRNLNNIIKRQNLNPNDLKFANDLLKKMEKALKGEY